MNFWKSITQPVVNLCAWGAARFGGEAAADLVKAKVADILQGEVNAAKPKIISLVDGAIVGAEALAGDVVAFVRGRIVAGVDKLSLSDSAQTRVIGAIAAVEAPKIEGEAEATAEKVADAFAQAVKDAIEAL